MLLCQVFFCNTHGWRACFGVRWERFVKACREAGTRLEPIPVVRPVRIEQRFGNMRVYISKLRWISTFFIGKTCCFGAHAKIANISRSLRRWNCCNDEQVQIYTWCICERKYLKRKHIYIYFLFLTILRSQLHYSKYFERSVLRRRDQRVCLPLHRR